MGIHSFFGIPTDQEIQKKYFNLSDISKEKYNRIYKKLLIGKIFIQIIILIVLIWFVFR